MGLLTTLLLGMSILVGAWIAHLSKSETIELLSVSVAFGTMSLLAVLDLLPEALEYLSGKRTVFLFLFIILGILILKILDFFIPGHEHPQEAHGCKDGRTAHIGITTALAVIVHNLIEGMAVYSVSVQSVRSGLLMALGIGLHNIPMGMIIFSTIKEKPQKIKYILITLVSVSTFAGGLMMFSVSRLLNDFLLGAFIALALGMILYILFAGLLPCILRSSQKRESLTGILAGAAIMIVSNLLG